MNVGYRLQVNRHQNGLYALALSMLNDRLEAEDVVQDTFVKLWQQRQQGKKPNQAWLYKVTRNQCLDILQRRKLQAEYQRQQTHLERHQPPADQLTENAQLTKMLGQAIGQLTEPYRSLLLMREVNGLSYRTLGEVLNLNTSQTKVYLHRAKQQLKQQLKVLYEQTD